MIRNMAIGLVSAVALISAANAADMYRSEGGGGYKDGPVYVANTWTGFYIGANGGGAFSGDQDKVKLDFIGGAGNTGSNNRLKPEGGFGGGQIGYNWQGGFGPRVVLGVEADIQGGDINDSATSTVPGFPAATIRHSLDVNYFGTVRGRIGYAFDRTLIYGTGGFAYGGTTFDVNEQGPIAFAKGSKDETLTGFAVGGGLEYKLSAAWSLKGEYQFVDLGSVSSNLPGFLNGTTTPTGTSVRSETDVNFHTVRVGINYHMHDGYEPLK